MTRMAQIVGVNRETVISVRRTAAGFEYGSNRNGDGTVPVSLAMLPALETLLRRGSARRARQQPAHHRRHRRLLRGDARLRPAAPLRAAQGAARRASTMRSCARLAIARSTGGGSIRRSARRSWPISTGGQVRCRTGTLRLNRWRSAAPASPQPSRLFAQLRRVLALPGRFCRIFHILPRAAPG